MRERSSDRPWLGATRMERANMSTDKTWKGVDDDPAEVLKILQEMVPVHTTDEVDRRQRQARNSLFKGHRWTESPEAGSGQQNFE